MKIHRKPQQPQWGMDKQPELTPEQQAQMHQLQKAFYLTFTSDTGTKVLENLRMVFYDMPHQTYQNFNGAAEAALFDSGKRQVILYVLGAIEAGRQALEQT